MLDSIYRLLDQIGYPHPIHPTEVHMPIGLIVGALIFRVAGALLRRPALAQTAHYCTILALLFLFPTVLFGFMDWQHFYAGAWLYPIKIKILLAVVLIIMVFAGILLAYKRGVGSGFVLLNYSISFVLVVVLGYFGGDLVYGGMRPKAPESYLAGLDAFNANCVACHPRGGNIIDPSLPLLNSAYTRSPAAFIAFIRNPKRPDGSPGAMPTFSPQKISDQQVSDLYKYIVHVLENR
jgi:uncharacterized membrane protein